MSVFVRIFPLGPAVLLKTEEWIANFKMAVFVTWKTHSPGFYDSYLDVDYN